MRKLFKTLFLSLLSSGIMAQLSGTISVPGTYTSIAAAINALNTQGVNGATTIQISANYTETVPTGGFSITATGTALNPITFQKNGVGANPLLIAYSGGVGTPSTALQDGIWRMIGSDYITIDGIDLLDPNTANPATMEFGFGLFKASAADGCRNNTIKNCVIALKSINNVSGIAPAFSGSRGIEMVNALSNSHTLDVIVTAGSGASSNNKFYSNVIQNCNTGIALSGAYYASNSPYLDAGNDVGGNLAATGNTIISYGTTTSINSTHAVAAKSQSSLNVAYNAINTNTNTGVSQFGIHLVSIYNTTVASNSITLNGTTIYGIYVNYCLGATATNIQNNSVVNCNLNGGAFCGIYGQDIPGYLNVNNNFMSGLTSSTLSYDVNGVFIYNPNANQYTISVANNTIQNFPSINSNGSIVGINLNTNSQTNYSVQGNYLNNVGRLNGASGDLFGYRHTGAGSSSTLNTGSVMNNFFTNLNNGNGSNNLTTYGIYSSPAGAVLQSISNNFCNNITGGSGNTAGVFAQGYTYSSNSSSINNNTITNISSFNDIYGITTGASPLNINGNIIGSLLTTGASSVFGIRTTFANFSINKNKIYDLSSNGMGAAYVFGISSFYSSGNISNNIIGELRAPNSDYADALTGIHLQFSSTCTLNYNTVRIGSVSSTGLYFGSSALAALGSTFSVNNNVLINLSTPSGSSSAIALKQSSATILSTTYTSVYSSSSDNNLLYAGVPSTSNLIYSDGVNNVQTLSAFKTLVSPREASSVTENTPFSSVTGSSTNFLHVSPPSLAESNAVNISGINDDIDGNIRQGNSGYSGNGTAPDIGADEFNTPICSTVNNSTLTPSSLSICAGQTVALTRGATQFAIFAGTQLQWQRSTSSGGPYTMVAVASATSTSYATPTLTPGTYYYTFASTCSVSSQTAVSNEVTVTVYPYPQPTVSPAIPVICSSSSPSVNLTAIGANQFSWSPSTSLSSSNGSMVTANPATTNIYTVTGINPGGCTGTSTVAVFVYPNPTVSVSGNTIVCSGTNVNLVASGANLYSWSNGATQVSISPIVSALTVYSVTGTNSLGNCTGTTQYTVSVNPKPILTAIGGTVLCAGQQATLTVSGANTYLWSNNATTSSIIVTPLSTTAYNVTGTYTATGCSSGTQQVVSVVQIPVVTISGLNKACLGESINLSASGATSYTWNTGATSSGITVTPTANTNYSVMGVSGPGCSGSTVKTISVNPIPTATITLASSSVICAGETRQLVALSDIADQFNWSDGANIATITISPTTNTIFTVVVKNSVTNCSNTAIYNLTINPCTGINKMSELDLLKLQPNPFHLQFSLDWYGIEETRIEIFNAIGSLILVKSIQPGYNEINMEKFDKGLYYLKIKNVVKKIVSE